MEYWNTDLIIEDLKTIVGVIAIDQYDQINMNETATLKIRLGGVDNDLIIITGVLKNSKIDYIILKAGPYSDPGLSSTDMRVARAYIEVRQYFINRGVKVVGEHQDE
jgi:hypothetical protein